MVERLKSAIDKARAQRTGAAPTAAQTPRPASPRVAQAGGAQAAVALPETDILSDWANLPELQVDEAKMERERIVTRSRKDPAHRAFDMLRTRTMRTLQEKGWKRLAITSPTKGVGKTVVSINLAFSLARQKSTRVLLLDLDLAAPRIASVLCSDADLSMRKFLSGETPAEDFFRRFGDNLVVGLNREPSSDGAEILQSDTAKAALEDAIVRLDPDIIILDLSPVMVSDDALNVLANVDCAMMVVAAGETVANEIRESEKLINEWTTLLGLVLNKSEEKNRDLYSY